MRYLGLLLLFLYASTACQNEKTEQKADANFNYASFRVFYNEDSRKLRAEALFRQDSLSKALPGGVRFRGQDMSLVESPELGKRYSLEFTDAPYGGKLLFQYKDSLDFSMQATRLRNVKFPEAGIQKGQRFIFTWDGSPIGKDESLRIIITDGAGKSFTYNHVGYTPQAAYVIPGDRLKALQPGEGSILLVKTWRQRKERDWGIESALIEVYGAVTPIRIQ